MKAAQKCSFRKRYSRLECMKNGNWSKRSYDVLQTCKNHFEKDTIWRHNGCEWVNKPSTVGIATFSYKTTHNRLPSTVRLAEEVDLPGTPAELWILTVHVYIPPSLQLAWFMVRIRKPAPVLPDTSAPGIWTLKDDDPPAIRANALAKTVGSELASLLSTLSMFRADTTSPLSNSCGWHDTTTVPRVWVMLVVSDIDDGLTVILAPRQWPAKKKEKEKKKKRRFNLSTSHSLQRT